MIIKITLFVSDHSVCVGKRSFRSGYNLSSQHMPLQRRLAQKVITQTDNTIQPKRQFKEIKSRSANQIALFSTNSSARERGYLVLLVDEYLSYTMCPTCAAVGVSTRLAKPLMRACACLQCERWIHRDMVGAHNIAR